MPRQIAERLRRCSVVIRVLTSSRQKRDSTMQLPGQTGITSLSGYLNVLKELSSALKLSRIVLEYNTRVFGNNITGLYKGNENDHMGNFWRGALFSSSGINGFASSAMYFGTVKYLRTTVLTGVAFISPSVHSPLCDTALGRPQIVFILYPSWRRDLIRLST